MKKTLLIIAAFLVAQLIAGLIIALAFIIQAGNLDEKMMENYVPPISYMLIALMVSDIVIIIATILICRKGFVVPFRWNMPAVRGTLIVILSLVGMASLVTLTEALSEWLDLPDLMEDTFQSASMNPYALWAMAIVGPIAEEVACRYGIIGSLREKNYSAWVAILISAIVFSVLHMNPAQMLVAFIMGLFLGWIYIVTHSIWPCILCHVANNALSVLLMRTHPENPEEITLSNMIGNNTIYTVILIACAFVFAVAVLAIRKTTTIRAINN